MPWWKRLPDVVMLSAILVASLSRREHNNEQKLKTWKPWAGATDPGKRLRLGLPHSSMPTA